MWLHFRVRNRRKLRGNDIYYNFHDAKTSRESNDMFHMTIRCVNLPTSHQKDEKVDFSSNFGVYLASFLTTPKILKNVFRVQKKQGETCPKFKPSGWRKVLSMFFQKN